MMASRVVVSGRMMNLPITGGCLCGEVRYRIVSAPVRQVNCHCRSCQLWSGSVYLPLMFVPTEALTITGDFQEYPTVAASGNTVFRAFCSRCGSPLVGRNSALVKFRPVAAVSLDDASVFQPELDMWISDAQPWDFMDPGLPKYAGNFW